MCKFHAMAFVALLFSVANADRRTVEVRGPADSSDGKLASLTGCAYDGDGIWDKIMASPDAASIRAIPWKDIIDSITNFLNDKETNIGILEKVIDDLNQYEVPKTMSKDLIEALITSSFSAEGSYGSVENARSSSCGKPGKTPRVPFDAMEVAAEKIVALAQHDLSSGGVKSSKADFLNICNTFLAAGNDAFAGYCGALCNKLADVVQRLSDQTSSFEKSIALREKSAEKQQNLKDEQKKMEQCQQAKQSLDKLQKYLESLDVEIEKKHKAVRKAEFDLDVAQHNAADLLKSNHSNVQKAREALAAVTKDENEFVDQTGTAAEVVHRGLRDAEEELFLKHLDERARALTLKGEHQAAHDQKEFLQPMQIKAQKLLTDLEQYQQAAKFYRKAVAKLVSEHQAEIETFLSLGAW